MAEVLVTAAGAAAIAGLAWFFFAPARPAAAELGGRGAARGGDGAGRLSPDVIRARRGRAGGAGLRPAGVGSVAPSPGVSSLRLRAISGACPRIERTTVRLTPASRVVRVRLRDEHGPRHVAGRPDHRGRGCRGPSGVAPGVATPATRLRAGTTERAAGRRSTREAARRRREAEIADLTRRVVIGAVLTAPVLFAVMAHDVFGATWVPALLLNHWLQLALITPVMFYTGWPIHRTGWLALSHRGADMNSLITLGTVAAYGYSLLVTVAPGAAAGRRARGVLRGRRRHHHPDPARPAARGPRQGRHRRGDPRA